MAVLNFKNYRVISMSYAQNKEFDASSQKKISFKPKFGINLIADGKDEAKILLTFVSKNELPFNIKIVLEGSFKYNASEDEVNIGFEKLLKRNATAILFPYLRAIISQLTSMGNEYPPLLIPVMNIGTLLERKAKK